MASRPRSQQRWPWPCAARRVPRCLVRARRRAIRGLSVGVCVWGARADTRALALQAYQELGMELGDLLSYSSLSLFGLLSLSSGARDRDCGVGIREAHSTRTHESSVPIRGVPSPVAPRLAPAVAWCPPGPCPVVPSPCRRLLQQKSASAAHVVMRAGAAAFSGAPELISPSI